MECHGTALWIIFVHTTIPVRVKAVSRLTNVLTFANIALGFAHHTTLDAATSKLSRVHVGYIHQLCK
jgi:hypothetical protein